MTSEENMEKRKNPRIDVLLTATLPEVDGPQPVKDFSLCGIMLLVQNPSGFTVGQETHITMEIPPEMKSITLKVKVVHISGKGVGMEFVEMHPLDAYELESYFAIYRHTIPMKDE